VKRTKAILLALSVAATLAVPALVPAAGAQEFTSDGSQSPALTDDFSAADQYVESVPTSRGPKVPGVGKRAKHEAPALSSQAKASLSPLPEETAAELERIATSAELGAPTEKLETPKRTSTRVPAATVRASEVGDDDNLLWLVIALVALTALALSGAYLRHRARDSIG
jgi:hypothetical protein